MTVSPIFRFFINYYFFSFCGSVVSKQKYLCYIVQLNMCFEQIVALLGVLIYKFYGEELREIFGYEEHPYAFYIMAGTLASHGLPDFLSFSMLTEAHV